jgi:hypothetical protein
MEELKEQGKLALEDGEPPGCHASWGALNAPLRCHLPCQGSWRSLPKLGVAVGRD